MSTKSLEEVFEESGLNMEKQEQFRSFLVKNDFEGLVKAKVCNNEKQATKIWAEAREAYKTVLLTRYPVKQGPNHDPTASIMGGCGNGKTSLMNNICGTSHRVGQEMHSLTRNITREKVLYVEPEDFNMYDTAGTTSDQQVSLHAGLLRATLTHKPLNTIFVHVKFQNRGIDIIKDMLLQLKPIEKYEENIVYLISHFDQAKDPEKERSAISAEMTKLGMPQQVVFYSNTQCNKQELALTLCTICSNYQKVSIRISEEEFLKNFRIGSLDRIFEKEKEQSLHEIKDIKKIYSAFVEELPDNDEREAIIQDLALSLKYELQDELETFFKAAKQKIDDSDYYGVFYELQKIILDATEDFARQTARYRRYGLFGKQSEEGKKKDIRDLIKQCPNCDEIWYRVEACPKTTCGHRPSSFWDFIGRVFTSYIVKREGKRLSVTRKSKKQVDKTQMRVDEEYKTNVELSKTKQGSRRGCGFALNFDQLPRLPNIDEILKEWYSVATISELDAKLKADEIAQRQREAEDLEIQRNLLNLNYRDVAAYRPAGYQPGSSPGFIIGQGYNAMPRENIPYGGGSYGGGPYGGVPYGGTSYGSSYGPILPSFHQPYGSQSSYSMFPALPTETSIIPQRPSERSSLTEPLPPRSTNPYQPENSDPSGSSCSSVSTSSRLANFFSHRR